MTPYLVLARKYRPTCFSQLQGQETLVRTLTHAIKRQHLAHAYLLTGSHGIGKTTIARVFAKIINCTNPCIGDEEVKACENCPSCVLIQGNNHPDQLEIDAASHTGVEDIRIITDHIEYKPLQGKYRVFIIDEVHMLSKSAFNALLKTLEEPPAHVIFIFATTEVHKLPLTVISRCQRFDLRRLKIEDLMSLLKSVCKSEKINYEEPALQLIATSSDGSARDALSVLDQVCILASTEVCITAALTEAVLGRASREVVVKLLSCILSQKTDQALTIVQELYQANTDLIWLNRNLLEIVHYLSRIKLMPDYSLPIFAAYQDVLKNLAQEAKLAHLTHLWQIFISGDEEIKNAFNPSLAIEMLIIKAIYALGLPTPHQLAKALSRDNGGTQGASKIQTNFTKTSSSPRFVAPASPVALPSESHERSKGEEQLSSFLQYVYQQKEIELYYYLMNEVDARIVGEQITLIGAAVHRKTKEMIQRLLTQWEPSKSWQLRHEIAERFVSFKQRLSNNFTRSSAYQQISQAFPNAELADITLATD